jgi:MFS transporter, CP family, cyanate transporter
VTSATSATSATRAVVAPTLLVAAIMLLALNMRGPIVAVSPVTEMIRADLGIDGGTAGLLTSLPVLCFGLATPLASALLARLGLGRGVRAGLGVLVAGIVVRSLDGLTAALAGTLLIGAALTVANVAVPVVVGRELRPHAGAVLGAYTAAFNVGSMLTLALTVPIADAYGWRFALAAWGALVLVAAGVWWWATRSLADLSPAPQAADSVERSYRWWRRPVVWGLTIAFAGQAFTYYGVTAWLPVLLTDRLGMTASQAGASASIFQITAIAGSAAVPVLLRWCAPRVVVAAVFAAWVVLPLGLLLVPSGWALWCVVGGVAQGGRDHGDLRPDRPQRPRCRREPGDIGVGAGWGLYRCRHRPVRGGCRAPGVGRLDGAARRRSRVDPAAGRRGPAVRGRSPAPAGGCRAR